MSRLDANARVLVSGKAQPVQHATSLATTVKLAQHVLMALKSIRTAGRNAKFLFLVSLPIRFPFREMKTPAVLASAKINSELPQHQLLSVIFALKIINNKMENVIRVLLPSPTTIRFVIGLATCLSIVPATPLPFLVAQLLSATVPNARAAAATHGMELSARTAPHSSSQHHQTAASV